MVPSVLGVKWETSWYWDTLLVFEEALAMKRNTILKHFFFCFLASILLDTRSCGVTGVTAPCIDPTNRGEGKLTTDLQSSIASELHTFRATIFALI